MRESEKNELIERLDVIEEALHSAKYWVQHDSDPNGIHEAMFRFGTASAYITRLREDIRNTETDPGEDDYPELPAKAPAAEDTGITLAGSSGWKKYKAALKDEAGTAGRRASHLLHYTGRSERSLRAFRVGICAKFGQRTDRSGQCPDKNRTGADNARKNVRQR